ncbi:MAG: hypothetical protein J7577_13405 [Sphingobacteriaceae bacterium]|nr:hypothetical protein [Sphingobacteriaceae bacterium]
MENNLPTTWEEVCQSKGIDPNQLPDVSLYPKKHQAAAVATFKWYHVLEVLNTNPETKLLWEPDWKDYDQAKYYNWWDMDDADSVSGFGFDGAYYGDGTAYTSVGSRLVFKSRDIARHAAKHFIDLYKDMLVIPAE